MVMVTSSFSSPMLCDSDDHTCHHCHCHRTSVRCILQTLLRGHTWMDRFYFVAHSQMRMMIDDAADGDQDNDDLDYEDKPNLEM